MPKRKCDKCGLSTNADDPNMKLHRFPKPGSTNMRRCEMWAKYLFPDKPWSSVDFQQKLYSEHRTLCNKHFKDSEFTNIEEKKLCKHAVPDMVDFDEEINAQSMKKLCNVNIQVSETMLEVCVDSLESAINAIHGGADELEVCSSLAEGGLTPSLGLVKKVQALVAATANGRPIRKSCRNCACNKLRKKAKVNVMIRCRSGSDFVYSVEDMETMLADMEVFKGTLVDRYVFGALTETGHIDEINCDKIVAYAYPTPVTFHRAFDLCTNPTESITKINNLGFGRLLTSGQKATADDPEAIDLLKSLHQAKGHDIDIMPGAGVNLTNARSFIDMGFRWLHSSCKRIRNPTPEINNELKLGTSDRELVYVTDENTVRMMKELMNENVINLT